MTADEQARERRAAIETRAGELTASWINGNRADVLDEVCEPMGQHAMGPEIRGNVALVAAFMWMASCIRAAEPNLAEDFCDALMRRATE